MIQFNNEFKIFAHGEGFDVDAFIEETALLPDYVWRRGDQRKHACIESLHTTSGVEFHLGDGRTIPFPEQQGIAIRYLKDHREQLRSLGQHSGVETFVLGLQYAKKLASNVYGFVLGPSQSLMWHALDVGVSPTFYVQLDRQDGQQPNAR